MIRRVEGTVKPSGGEFRADRTARLLPKRDRPIRIRDHSNSGLARSADRPSRRNDGGRAPDVFGRGKSVVGLDVGSSAVMPAEVSPQDLALESLDRWLVAIQTDRTGRRA